MKPLSFNSTLIAALISFFSIVSVSMAGAQDISLFDNAGVPCAYISVEEEFTIYLWSGEPVAYLENDSIWGFNGKHLGWLEDGLVREHKGYVVGFIAGAVDMRVQKEPFKNFKKFKPLKSFKEFSPSKPSYKNQWSGNKLTLVLYKGMK